MTKEEAIAELDTYKLRLSLLFLSIAAMFIDFPINAVTEGLGLPADTLAKSLDVQAICNTQAAYLAVLENAAKGQLMPVEVDDFFTRENVISE